MKNKGVLVDYVLEGVVTFALVVIGLIIETYRREILFIGHSLNTDVAQFIVSRTFFITLLFVFGYRVARSVLYPFYKRFLTRTREVTTDRTTSFLTDVFLITSFILVSAAIRPVLQETYMESNIRDFEYFLVRHDALFSVITLILIAMPLLYVIHKRETNKTVKQVKAAVIVLIICAVGTANASANYSARISESRSSWIQKNWQQQSEDAKLSLENAKTDEEKSTAYYWLGIAENRQGNPEKAAEYQLRAIQLQPNYYAAHASLANAYAALGEAEMSYMHAQKCIEYGPRYAWCYQALMNYYLIVGDAENAKINAQKATELDPENRELADIYKTVSGY